jgi:hypothetical protein
MSALPSYTDPTYATDEDIIVRAGGDFGTLCPSWQVMAAGNDGAFAAGAPWTLSSASVDFLGNGVLPNHVVWLKGPQNVYPGGGQFLAIDSVTTGSVVLRRVHKDLNVGAPPAPAAGLTSVTFVINTLDPQTEEATYQIKQQFSIDENMPQRTSAWLYDVRQFRVATILTVLQARYTQEARGDRGDFPRKIALLKSDLSDCVAKLSIRWGPLGDSAGPTNLFSNRIFRG